MQLSWKGFVLSSRVRIRAHIEVEVPVGVIIDAISQLGEVSGPNDVLHRKASAM